MIWYLENSSRFKLEREALEILACRVEWLTPSGWHMDKCFRVVWEGDISVPAGNRPVLLVYPNHFPFSPPLVLPRGDAARWSAHQWAGGELCLEYGADNWHQDISGADMIESAHRLLEGEEPIAGLSETLESRHAVTVGQELRKDRLRFLLTRALNAELQNLPEGIMAIGSGAGVLCRDESIVYIVESITFPDGPTWKDEVPNAAALGWAKAIALLRLPSDKPFPPTDSLTHFRAAVAVLGPELPDVMDIAIVTDRGVRAFYLNADNDTVTEVAVIPPEPFIQRLDQCHDGLVDRKVSLVGCGSLGSKIAVMLARSGVGGFFLVDDDLLLPDNLVRHDLDWRDIGFHKAAAVARRIKFVNPKAQCSIRKHRLGGQESSGSIETILETLAENDLIIDATAEPNVFNYLCAAVAMSQKPLIWSEIFGGGFGGLIARHRPSIEPDPASMRREIENWCAERRKPLPKPTHRYGGETDSSMIADDADVTVIAAHTARMAIDLLIARNPSIFPHSVYMVGLSQGGEIFDQPFETYPIDVGSPVPETQVTEDSEEAASEFQFIKQLFTDFADAAAGTAIDNQAS